jgi:hypothetical protein
LYRLKISTAFQGGGVVEIEERKDFRKEGRL